MSNDLMKHVNQTMKEQYDKGWREGNAAAWESIAHVAAECLIDLKATEPSPQNGVEETPKVAEVVEPPVNESEPRLTAAQQRAVDYVRDNPGLKSREIKGIGKGTLQGLLNAGVLVKRGPQFYPAEQN